ncbi:hypothetical protein CAPTEDRAFT_210774 [Capitella teleta]|uniref:Uncharacterized protein n=1 Tax=Capitella teleta TaxID=283909 RepID=R7UFV4_CAPTE|nr:hypothetical protein CAPTEDRAFT_210774 [Capitella teleta]|eukprot:ELU05055.1 hypothetical protein CAPTEDRAFT_210774 [Capitella teleta]
MDHYNRHAKERDELQELQRVWFKKEPTANWKPATVIERPSDSPRAYIVQDDAGTCFQRTSNDRKITTPKERADHLNTFFTNIEYKVASQIPPSDTTIDTYLQPINAPPFDFHPITQTSTKSFTNLNPNTQQDTTTSTPYPYSYFS